MTGARLAPGERFPGRWKYCFARALAALHREGKELTIWPALYGLPCAGSDFRAAWPYAKHAGPRLQDGKFEFRRDSGIGQAAHGVHSYVLDCMDRSGLVPQNGL